MGSNFGNNDNKIPKTIILFEIIFLFLKISLDTVIIRKIKSNKPINPVSANQVK